MVLNPKPDFAKAFGVSASRCLQRYLYPTPYRSLKGTLGSRAPLRDRKVVYRVEGDSNIPYLVVEWIHFTLFEITSPTKKPKVYTFWAYELSN